MLSIGVAVALVGLCANFGFALRSLRFVLPGNLSLPPHGGDDCRVF